MKMIADHLFTASATPSW